MPFDDQDECSGGGVAEPLLDSAGIPICGEDPSLSPDGQTLYFSTGGQFAELDLATRQISIYDWAEEPWIGPDGIRYIHISGGDLIIQEVADTSGATSQQVTFDGDAFFPRWAAPSRALLFGDDFESGDLLRWSAVLTSP